MVLENILVCNILVSRGFIEVIKKYFEIYIEIKSLITKTRLVVCESMYVLYNDPNEKRTSANIRTSYRSSTGHSRE